MDLVTYAQVFHWVTAETAVPEARRVLRDGGALAVWWHDTGARDQPWWQAQQAELERLVDGYARHYRASDPTEALRRRHGDRGAVGANAGRGDVRLDAFPDGMVVEPYVTRLWVAG